MKKIILLVLIVMLLLCGCESHVDEGYTPTPDETEKTDSSEELEYFRAKSEELDEKLDASIEDYNTLYKKYSGVEDVQAKIDELNIQKEELQTTISDLKSQKKELNKELKTLNGKIIKASGKPKNYPAGRLYAGKDFKVGRYRVYNGSSNWQTYDEYGDIDANIILGKGKDFYVEEYIYDFKEGYRVDADSPFTMEPIE